MGNKRSGSQISEELQLFMVYHRFRSMKELVSLSNEKLFRLESMTMHLML